MVIPLSAESLGRPAGLRGLRVQFSSPLLENFMQVILTEEEYNTLKHADVDRMEHACKHYRKCADAAANEICEALLRRFGGAPMTFARHEITELWTEIKNRNFSKPI